MQISFSASKYHCEYHFANIILKTENRAQRRSEYSLFILIIIMVIARQARISLFFPREEKNPDKVISVKEMLKNKNNGMRFHDLCR